jgi:sulfite exporter TauE/SafE
MNAMLFVSALLMGVLGSSHCVVMCGGVVAMTCSAMPLARRRRPVAQLPMLLAYNGGRITSYILAGTLAGAIGTTLQSVGAVQAATLGLRLAAGLMMIGLGLYLAGFGGALRWAEHAGAPLWRRIAPLAKRLVPVRGPLQAFALGSLWGFLPCGLVYAALASAVASGSVLGGAITMGAFGLGTLPMLLGMGSAAALLTRVVRGRRVRLAGALVVATFGLVQIGDAGVAFARADRSPPCCAGHQHPVAAR